MGSDGPVLEEPGGLLRVDITSVEVVSYQALRQGLARRYKLLEVSNPFHLPLGRTLAGKTRPSRQREECLLSRRKNLVSLAFGLSDLRAGEPLVPWTCGP
jgi:hypothetical protein